MEESTKEVKTSMEIPVLQRTIIDAIQDMKGENIVALDLKSIADAPSDYFVITDAESGVRCQAIARNIKTKVKQELGVNPHHIEGLNEAKWILLDYLDVLVHIFYQDQREYYNLEDLWQDARTIKF